MKLQQTIILISLCIDILILILGGGKSNKTVVKKKHVDTWAIIGREFVEFTEEEIEWRSQYVK